MKGSNFKLLSHIFRGAWLMHPDTAMAQMPLVNALLEGNHFIFGDDEDPAPIASAAYFQDNKLQFHFDDIDSAPEGSVALIPVKGTIMKEDFCGEPGTETLGAMMKQADANPNIIGAVHVHDSPGGSVDGTEVFSNTAANTKKPVVGFVDGMACSASYWGISGTNHIMLSGETAMVGSIGVMVSFYDVREMMEKQGVKEHIIFASKSTEKNRDYLEARDGKYEKIIKEDLDPINEVFMGAVKDARPAVTEAQLNGSTYYGTAAIKAGLADSIGTLEQAIAKVVELSGTTTQSISINNKQNEMFNSKLDKAVEKLAAKKKAGEEILAEDIALVSAELVAKGLEGFAIATEKGIEAIQTANDSLTAENAALKTAQAEHETKLTAISAELATALEKVAEFGGKPAATTTEPEKKKDTSASAGKEDPLKVFDENTEAAIAEAQGAGSTASVLDEVITESKTTK